MKVDWRRLAGTVAPALVGALGGPVAGPALAVLARTLLGREDATQAEVQLAVERMTPEQASALAQADLAFRVEQLRAGVDLERIESADRADARQREIATSDWTPRVLAYLVTFGFFGVLGGLIAYGKPDTGGDALLILLGSLGTAWTGIVAYYFGSSAGSARKTAMLDAQGRGA